MSEDKAKTEKQLEEVNGGIWRESDGDYASGDTPRFKVGEIVRIARGDYHVDNIAKILEVSSSKHGYWNTEFVYKIQKNKYGTLRFEWCDGGIIIDDVYESQLDKFNG